MLTPTVLCCAVLACAVLAAALCRLFCCAVLAPDMLCCCAALYTPCCAALTRPPGRETLFEEEYGEDEVEEELAPLTVQLAHVLARAGRQAEAHEVLEALISSGSLECPDYTDAAKAPTKAVRPGEGVQEWVWVGGGEGQLCMCAGVRGGGGGGRVCPAPAPAPALALAPASAPAYASTCE